ncbi:MAG: GGDEF domain-containing protein [Deltaproteobacteria bacterium]|nr:GGDEF domain-containing protein [Deltaproteobacteria bacterium]
MNADYSNKGFVHSGFFFPFFIPNGLIYLATLIFIHSPLLKTWHTGIPRITPYLLLIAGFLVALLFNRSRVIYALTILAIIDRAIAYMSNAGLTSIPGVHAAYLAITFLLPLNVAALSLVKERGIFTPRGLWRVSIIAIEVIATCIFYLHPNPTIIRYLEYSPLSTALFNRIPMPQLSIILFSIAALLLVFTYTRDPDAITSGFFWTLATYFTALLSPGEYRVFNLYTSSAMLILIISLVISSYKMAFHDELTGLPARRALNEELLKLTGRYTIAMADIDFFKKFNDRYGHAVGDQVLRMVASRMSRVAGVKAFRYGGEEFVLVLSGKGKKEALPILEYIRQSVEITPFVIRGPNRPKKKPKPGKARGKPRERVSVTISIGAAERDTSKDKNPRDVLRAADKALYAAKKAGRNRVSL